MASTLRHASMTTIWYFQSKESKCHRLLISISIKKKICLIVNRLLSFKRARKRLINWRKRMLSIRNRIMTCWKGPVLGMLSKRLTILLVKTLNSWTYKKLMKVEYLLTWLRYLESKVLSKKSKNSKITKSLRGTQYSREMINLNSTQKKGSRQRIWLNWLCRVKSVCLSKTFSRINTCSLKNQA